MATGWKLPTGTPAVDTLSGTAWTNPGNVTADDGVEAEEAITAKNTPATGSASLGWLKGANLGFDAAIPANASIDKVEIRAEWRVTSTGGIANREIMAAVGGTRQGTINTLSTEPLTLETTVYDVTAAMTRWERADLLNGTFEIHTRGRNGNSTTNPGYRWDHIAAQVTYIEWDQVAFRARNDDGDETTATWKAAQNTDWEQAVDENFRLRFELQNLTADPTSTNNVRQFQLHCRKNAGTWQDVTDTSTIAKASPSPNLLDGAATTDQLTAGTGTFVTGRFSEVGGATTIDNTVGASGHTEAEFCIQLVGADLAASDVVDFRLVRWHDDNPLSAYTVADASATVPAGGVTVSVGAATAIGAATGVAVLASAVPSASLAVGSTVDAVSEVLVSSSAASALGIAPTATAVIGNNNVSVQASAALAVGLTGTVTTSIVGPATAALASGVAPVASSVVSSPASPSIALGTAPQAASGVATAPPAALALGSTPPAVVRVTTSPTAALATGIAPAPTVISGSGSTVTVSAATATGTATATPLVAASVPASFATATAAFGSVSISRELAPALAVAITGTATAIGGEVLFLTTFFDQPTPGGGVDEGTPGGVLIFGYGDGAYGLLAYGESFAAAFGHYGQPAPGLVRI